MEQSILYKGLTIISRPRQIHDHEYFAEGLIRGIPVGYGNQNWSLSHNKYDTEEEAHKEFIKFAKTYIDQEGLSDSSS